MAGYRHGIYISEVPTSLVPPTQVDSAMPVAFVTAPVHLVADPYAATNVPKLCYTYEEVVSYFGFHLKEAIWRNYTAPEVIYSQFALYACAPVVIINVLNPKKHKQSVANEKITVEGKAAVLEVDGVLLDTVKVKNLDSDNKSEAELIAGEHYSLAFDDDGYVVVNILQDVGNELALSYDKLDPSKVDIYDFIGGYDVQAGTYSGLELINEVYPRFRLVPGQLIVPKYSMEPSIAAIMETKAGNINGLFRCIALNDMPTAIKENGEMKKLVYTDVPAWKTDNTYVSTRQINCYPKVRMSAQEFHFSTQLAGLICAYDAQNGGVPYASPSNQVMKINGMCYEGGEELVLNTEQANYLNGQGIVTAHNFVKGWTAWGNRTGAYPGNSDVKDNFISIRRMFDWIGNSIVLTYWDKVDLPITRRSIDTIVNSINMWFNGLQAQGYILGGRIEFREDENVTTDLIDGIIKFRVLITPPSPMRDMEFILEYDPSYIEALFN